MSKYIKLEDAIEAYNQAVTNLVESEMEEFDLGDFTECQFDTTQIKLIARMIESLPTIGIVTCEKCGNNKRNTDGVDEDWCWKFGYEMESDDWCSYAERI